MTEIEVIFEKFWNRTVPFPWSQSATLKKKAQESLGDLLHDLADFAGRPNVVQTVISINKIGRMLQAAQVISQDNDPDPETVEAAIKQILEKLQKEKQPTP